MGGGSSPYFYQVFLSTDDVQRGNNTTDRYDYFGYFNDSTIATTAEPCDDISASQNTFYIGLALIIIFTLILLGTVFINCLQNNNVILCGNIFQGMVNCRQGGGEAQDTPAGEETDGETDSDAQDLELVSTQSHSSQSGNHEEGQGTGITANVLFNSPSTSSFTEKREPLHDNNVNDKTSYCVPASPAKTHLSCSSHPSFSSIKFIDDSEEDDNLSQVVPVIEPTGLLALRKNISPCHGQPGIDVHSSDGASRECREYKPTSQSVLVIAETYVTSDDPSEGRRRSSANRKNGSDTNRPTASSSSPGLPAVALSQAQPVHGTVTSPLETVSSDSQQRVTATSSSTTSSSTQSLPDAARAVPEELSADNQSSGGYYSASEQCDPSTRLSSACTSPTGSLSSEYVSCESEVSCAELPQVASPQCACPSLSKQSGDGSNPAHDVSFPLDIAGLKVSENNDTPGLQSSNCPLQEQLSPRSQASIESLSQQYLISSHSSVTSEHGQGFLSNHETDLNNHSQDNATSPSVDLSMPEKHDQVVDPQSSGAVPLVQNLIPETMHSSDVTSPSQNPLSSPQSQGSSPHLSDQDSLHDPALGQSSLLSTASGSCNLQAAPGTASSTSFGDSSAGSPPGSFVSDQDTSISHESMVEMDEFQDEFLEMHPDIHDLMNGNEPIVDGFH